MQTFIVIRAWLASKLHRADERGQSTVEYTLIIMGVALFLVVASFALQDVLQGPISKTSTWIAGQNPP